MTRHGKNATASSVYSYHERQKDTSQSEYGTQAARVGKDSVKDFDACSLTLQNCKNPMVTSEGLIYDREAILQYIVGQKRKNAKSMKNYDKQMKADARELKELAQAEQRAKTEKFIAREKSIIDKSTTFQNKSSVAEEDQPSTSNPMKSDPKNLLSFWIPELTPEAKKTKLKKPDSKVFCPVSGKSIKFKDLIPVKFTPIADGDTKTSVISKKARWQCAVTHDALGNSVPCAVLRTTGDVVTMQCVDKIIRNDETMLHPLTGEVLQEKDIIQIKRGGTGFAHTNEGLKTKSYRPVLIV